MREGRGNDDEAICAPALGKRKSRLLGRAPHPTSPLRIPRNDTVWAFQKSESGDLAKEKYFAQQQA